MNEIEKMMQNAGIEPIAEYCKHQCNNEFDDDACIGCKHIEKVEYPSFTAEKQLEITKFLLKKAVYYDVKDDKYWFYYEECESAGYKPFDEAIAHFINKLWQNLTTEEQQQVKGILE